MDIYVCMYYDILPTCQTGQTARRAAAGQLPVWLNWLSRQASHSAGMAGYNMSVIGYAAGFVLRMSAIGYTAGFG